MSTPIKPLVLGLSLLTFACQDPDARDVGADGSADGTGTGDGDGDGPGDGDGDGSGPGDGDGDGEGPGDGDGEGPGDGDGDVPPALPLEGDLLTYAPSAASTAFNQVVRLSDGSFLVSGAADDLDWVDAAVPRIELGGADNLNTSEPGRVGFLLHISDNLGEVLEVAAFPAGTVTDIGRIRSTEVPGKATGDLYISGRRNTASPTADGYYIARLDNNFVNGAPSGALWAYEVVAPPREASGFAGQSAYEILQPWDVNAQGEVVFGVGAEYDFKWAGIYKLDANGERTTVEHWPAHWGDGSEHYGNASTYPGTVDHSAVVLKAGRLGSQGRPPRQPALQDHGRVQPAARRRQRQRRPAGGVARRLLLLGPLRARGRLRTRAGLHWLPDQRQDHAAAWWHRHRPPRREHVFRLLHAIDPARGQPRL